MSSRRGRGEGSIEQLPSGKFRAVLSLGRGGDGKRRRLAYTADTKKAALAWLRERQSEQRRGELADAGGRTVGAWLTEWLQLKKGKVEPNTYAWYERRVRLHITSHLGGLPLAKLQPLDVEGLYARLEPGEGHRAATTLRAALEDAVRHGLLARNPARPVKKPKVRRREMRPLSREQALALLTATRHDRLAAYYDLALDSGARPGELWALHWPDVDWRAGSIHVHRSLEEIGGALRLKAPKTRKAVRKILLAPRTLAAVARHRRRMRAEGRDVEAGPVFVDREGGFLRRSNFRRDSFLPALRRAGLAGVRPYDMRHTSATLLLSADVNIKVVSERLGHESIELTLRHYAHCIPGMQERAAAAVEAIFGDSPTADPERGWKGGAKKTQEEEE